MLLEKPPILMTLAHGEPMLLYIISAALVVERDETDKC
jgi:hypothetical protein